MKSFSLILALASSLSCAALAQTGGAASGGSASGGSASGGSASGGSANGAATGGAATSTGHAATGATGGAPTAAGGGTPATPGSIDNQIQSQQNQGGGTGGRGNAVQTRPSTQPMANPPVSGSRRNATTRANAQAKCDDVLKNRDRHTAQEIIACEQPKANDPAVELDRRLQRENSRAVNSICRGC